MPVVGLVAEIGTEFILECVSSVVYLELSKGCERDEDQYLSNAKESAPLPCLLQLRKLPHSLSHANRDGGRNLPPEHDRYCQLWANQISLFLPSFSILSEGGICFNYNWYTRERSLEEAAQKPENPASFSNSVIKPVHPLRQHH